MTTLVEVAQFYDPSEAYCAKGYLTSCGIDTIVQNENHLSVAPSLRIALGGYRLLALSDQKDLALAALGDVRPNQFENDEIAIDHENVMQKERDKRRKTWFWLPLILFCLVPFIPTYRNRVTFVGQFLLIILPFYLAAIWSYLWWIGFLD